MYAKPSYKKQFLLFILLTTVSVLTITCKRRLPCAERPAEVNCAITLDKFLDGCYTTRNGTEHIRYSGDLVVKYYDHCARAWLDYNNYHLESPNTATKQPITINTKIPSRGPFKVAVSIIGGQCSLCANGWGGTSNDVIDHCIAVPIAGGTQAAYPKWGDIFTINTPGPAFTLRPPHERNVANTCGCPVAN